MATMTAGTLPPSPLTVTASSTAAPGNTVHSIPDDDNAVVSYQMAVYAPLTGARKSGVIPTEGMSRRNRLSMRGFLGRVVTAAIAEGMIPLTGKLKIALVAHFSRADLPGFRPHRHRRRHPHKCFPIPRPNHRLGLLHLMTP